MTSCVIQVQGADGDGQDPEAAPAGRALALQALHGGGRRGAVDCGEGEDAGHHGGRQRHRGLRDHEAQIRRLRQGDECQRQQVMFPFCVIFVFVCKKHIHGVVQIYY